ncbi:right-handed parallel beta-helix repeat-containing protein [Candidatus Bathyarchaeota archaeon]|nr:right-handed parallel beta-helix repeat-containing protein [Candidatus Bathyarchaeota archaeon]
MKTKVIASMIFIVLLTNMLAVLFNSVPPSVAAEDVLYEVLDEVGTHFELPQFNIFITTDTIVHIRLFASSEVMGYFIENASVATYTQLALGTLKPLTTYYMYEDSYVNENVFTTDDVGSYTYVQDLSQNHQVFIQQRSSTMFISESTTLQFDIYEAVAIIADNVVLDLNGYSIIGDDWIWAGVEVYNRNNVTIKNGGISNFWFAGIDIYYSADIVISNNTITSNIVIGMYLGHSMDVVICNNTFHDGMELSNADFSLIKDNTFTEGFHFGWGSTGNIVYHNNFVDCDAWSVGGPWPNIWDNGYPSGGNYWSYYTGVDLYNGPDQDIPGSDGIGDTPYTIDADNIDHYPLMNSWAPMEVSIEVGGVDEPVVMVSNTTITKVISAGNNLHFESSGPTGETAYMNVIMPMVNTSEIKVFIDHRRLTPPPFPVISTDGTHYFIYFLFALSTHTVAIQFAPAVAATIDIDPDTLNLKINGEFITTYMQLPEGYDVADIVLETVNMEGIQAVTDTQYGFVTDPDSYLLDLDGDGIAETRMIKFDRACVIDYIEDNMDWSDPQRTIPLTYLVTLAVTGSLHDGTCFEGNDTIRVLKFLKGDPKPE